MNAPAYFRAVQLQFCIRPFRSALNGSCHRWVAVPRLKWRNVNKARSSRHEIIVGYSSHNDHVPAFFRVLLAAP